MSSASGSPPAPSGPVLRRRGFLAAGVVALGGFAAPGIAAFGTNSRSGTVRVGDTVDRNNPEVHAEEFFVQRLHELTGGRLQGNAYPNGVLGGHDRMNEQLRNGALEMAKSNVANLEAYDKRMGIFALPYGFADRKHLYAAEDGDLGRQLAAALRRKGLVVLGWFDSGERNVYNTVRPIAEPADLRGLKLRIQSNQIMIDVFNTLGAQSTPLDTNQIYSALQQGVVSGAENSVTFYVQQHHNEIAKFYSYTRHFFSVDPLLASARWFDSLDRRTRDAVVQAAQEAQQHERSLWDASDQKSLETAKRTGSSINECDVEAFKKATAVVYDRHRAVFGNLLDYLGTR